MPKKERVRMDGPFLSPEKLRHRCMSMTLCFRIAASLALTNGGSSFTKGSDVPLLLFVGLCAGFTVQQSITDQHLTIANSQYKVTNGSTINSKEIIGRPPCHVRLTSPRSWFELNKSMAVAVINFQNGCHIPTSVTIIWSTEYSNNFLFLYVHSE